MSEMGSDDIDPALMSADREVKRFALDRLRVRRKMAVIAFVQLIIGGAAVIFAGLAIPDLASRVDHMGMFLSLYFGSLASIIGWYWHVSAREAGGGMFGGYSGSGYGGGGYGGGGYGGMSGGAYSSTPMTHPHLTKNPVSVTPPT
jgi:uncharacterized membrane protein YgcG